MKPKRIGNKITILLIALFSSNCEDFFEKDITDIEFKLIAPYDGMVSEEEDYTFWWDWVSGADYYNLLIVTPSFDEIAKPILDTVITNNKFELSIEPGEYEWQVLAYNYSSETTSDIYSLNVDTSNTK